MMWRTPQLSTWRPLTSQAKISGCPTTNHCPYPLCNDEVSRKSVLDIPPLCRGSHQYVTVRSGYEGVLALTLERALHICPRLVPWVTFSLYPLVYSPHLSIVSENTVVYIALRCCDLQSGTPAQLLESIMDSKDTNQVVYTAVPTSEHDVKFIKGQEPPPYVHVPGDEEAMLRETHEEGYVFIAHAAFVRTMGISQAGGWGWHDLCPGYASWGTCRRRACTWMRRCGRLLLLLGLPHALLCSGRMSLLPPAVHTCSLRWHRTPHSNRSPVRSDHTQRLCWRSVPGQHPLDALLLLARRSRVPGVLDEGPLFRL